MVSASNVINPGLPKLPYDTAKDFAAISVVADVPIILIVQPSLPVRSVSELVALAKTKPALQHVRHTVTTMSCRFEQQGGWLVF